MTFRFAPMSRRPMFLSAPEKKNKASKAHGQIRRTWRKSERPGGSKERWWLNDPKNIASGKHTKNYGKSPFLMGTSTISMAIFNSYVKLPEGMILKRWLSTAILGININHFFWIASAKNCDSNNVFIVKVTNRMIPICIIRIAYVWGFPTFPWPRSKIWHQ